jgi:hypothetical protein
MNAVLRQLQRWRSRERAIRLIWGGGKWLAITATILALACLTDWVIDRYSGSQSWREFLNSSWIFAGVDPLSVGETPSWFRYLMTLGQLAIAGTLAFYFLWRPWLKTPPIDDLATQAEKAYPVFDHRLVTSLQLNRPTAKTQGMSKTLISEVTREADDLAARHDLLKLVDYRRVWWSAAVVAPLALAWLLFVAINPALAAILVGRQALLSVDIPRKTHLKNDTQEVWPTGAEVLVRFKVTGEYDSSDVGVLRIVPEGQSEEFYSLVFEKEGDGFAHFATKLPASSRDFVFQARLRDGRTKEAGQVKFEPPPQLAPADEKNPPLFAKQVLPSFLGLAPDGTNYTRVTENSARGEIIDALPQSNVMITARFNKPVKKARLIVLERAEGIRERERAELEPYETSEDRKTAFWGFPTTPKTIAYRIELVDDRDFTNPIPIRRNIRMWEDRPPSVEFKKESTRNPDPDDPEGKPIGSIDYLWDMALHPNGRVQVIYQARSELGIREANIRYRVIPKGVQMDLYPDWYKKIQHPREDPQFRVYFRQELIRVPNPDKKKLGEFVPDLGLFRYSLRGLSDDEQKNRIDAGFYPFPSADPERVPGELEAGGRRNFEVSDLRKMMPDGTFSKLAVGDTVELYMEVFDKLPGPDGKPLPNRLAGYSREAKRKIVMTENDVRIAMLQRGEERQKRTEKLRELTEDQIAVYKEKKKKE